MSKKLEQGLIHIYTGDGKGKTTAALGQGMRTAGAGYRVLMVQFLKGNETGELNSIEKLGEGFEIMRFGPINNFYRNLSSERRVEVKEDIGQGIEQIEVLMIADAYDLIILDEIMASIYLDIVSVEAIISLIDKKPNHVELILTGRQAPEVLVQRADYVTEMKMIKHPFEKGIISREGIEH
ncbi:ATP:corrinoid adenosyltransferase BtuR/CobO/CobP [Alkaliphilus metalliredigens QYMF]|uniref:ATP:corrinoid adenosyltransferase BtuR/CobO/CobP n=1 Tax=Alkaliphilus metalliredigens (strain QYMF) TaxID=293826 RepID=A6TU76_ALKMQ|nr:cob(I)yrinic acid a,c-diamide adenosyltransferase [Alkaliphilus metalliredigens]ABR49744.1 ATP:corrinoid adenosyltransferase BtuR/CobO/CobP [Alkaliphilus metalliredigens QYMF]